MEQKRALPTSNDQLDWLWAPLCEMHVLSRAEVVLGRQEAQVEKAVVDQEMESFRVQLQADMYASVLDILSHVEFPPHLCTAIMAEVSVGFTFAGLNADGPVEMKLPPLVPRAPRATIGHFWLCLRVRPAHHLVVPFVENDATSVAPSVITITTVVAPVCSPLTSSVVPDNPFVVPVVTLVTRPVPEIPLPVTSTSPTPLPVAVI